MLFYSCSISSYFASSSTAFLRHWVEWVMTCDALHSTTFTTISTYIDRKDARLQVVIMKVQDRKTCCILQRADTCSPFGPWQYDRTRFWYLFGCRVVIFEEFAWIWIYRLMYKINIHNRQICLWGDKWNTPTKQPMGRFILGCHGTCTTLLSFKGSPKMLRAELGGRQRWDIENMESSQFDAASMDMLVYINVHCWVVPELSVSTCQYTIIPGINHGAQTNHKFHHV